MASLVVSSAPPPGVCPIRWHCRLSTWQQVQVRHGPLFAHTRYPLFFSSSRLVSSEPSLVPPGPTKLPTTEHRCNENSTTEPPQHRPIRVGLRCSTQSSSQQRSAEQRLRQSPRHHHRPSFWVTRCTRCRAHPHGKRSAHPRSSIARLCLHDRTQACVLTHHQRHRQKCRQKPISPHRHNRLTARNTRDYSAHPCDSSVCLIRHDRIQARDTTRYQRNSQQRQPAPTSPHQHNWSTARNPLSSPASCLPFRHPKTEIHKSSGRAPARAAAARRTSPKARDLVTR